MPRKSRYNEPELVYHLISRFVDREWFIRDEEDRECYLTLLGRALSESDWRCLSYAAMSSHLHIAAIAGAQPLDTWVRRVHSPFADWMNRKHGRIGSLFVRGPKDFLTPRDRVGELIAYIHNNPVRANVVAAARDSSWTSHRAYLGLERVPAWLHVGSGLEHAGFVTTSSFDAWVMASPSDPSRAAIARELAARADDSRDWRAIRRRRDVRIDAHDVVERTASELGLSVASLCSRRRGSRHTLARRVATTCANTLGISGSAIARALGMSQQRASAILRCDNPPDEERDISSRVLERLAR